MKVLITGGAGFLGARIASACFAEDARRPFTVVTIATSNERKRLSSSLHCRRPRHAILAGQGRPFNIQQFDRCHARQIDGQQINVERAGDAAENLDWLSSDTKVPAVFDGAAGTQRNLDPRVVVPADVGVQGGDGDHSSSSAAQKCSRVG